jgi:nucleoid DNA-binding protein
MATEPKPISTKAAKPAATNAVASKVMKSPRATAPVTVASAAPKTVAAAAPVVTVMPKVADRVPEKADKASANALKKKDLIDRVLKVTGGKKKAVRDIVEATLNVLGDALSKGEMLNLPPFGKAKVSRPSDAGSGKAMTVKLRRGQGNGSGGGKAKLALADTEE